MRNDILSRRTARAMGSVMDICPVGDYSEYMPSGTAGQRISKSWFSVGASLRKAINKHADTKRAVSV